MAEKIVKDSQCLVNDLVNDTISRQAAIDALENIDCSDGIGISALKCDVVEDAINAINALPSAQPERKRGRWITLWRLDVLDGYQCSACKAWSRFKFNFCRNCGADMRGEQE